VRNDGSVGIASVVAEKESLKRRWVLDNHRFRMYEALVSDIDLIFGYCII
jgi:hypothetical protein